ncbi:ras-related protein Ral-B-like [Sycon ciliatum]|uniref:ras-related protein Ral-B-like n=1 Tax=Sycon ciliatum TaxID=27933 RepID=UPI0020AD5093|eukprot:scpid83776/ scgid26054/ 
MATTSAALEQERARARGDAVEKGRRGKRPSRLPSVGQFKRSLSSLRRGSTPRLQKVVFLGDVEVGKTAIISRLIGDYFSADYEPTMEEMHDYRTNLRGMEETVQILDTNGDPSEEVECLRERAIRMGNSFVVVFSVQKSSTLRRAAVLLEEIFLASANREIKREEVGRARRVVLVGNQADEEDCGDLDDRMDDELYPSASASPRQVSSSEAWQLADEYGIAEYIEVSARSGLGVDSIMRRLARLYQRKVEKEDEEEGKTFMKRVTSFLQPTRNGTSVRVKKKSSRSTQPPDVLVASPDERTSTLPRPTKTTRSNSKSPSEEASSPSEGSPPMKRGGLRASLGKAFGKRKRARDRSKAATTDNLPSGQDASMLHSAL